MSKKCVIEKYIYQSANAVKFVEVKKEDFFMIADLALKQLAISKTETTSCEACSEDYVYQEDWRYCPKCGRQL